MIPGPYVDGYSWIGWLCDGCWLTGCWTCLHTHVGLVDGYVAFRCVVYAKALLTTLRLRRFTVTGLRLRCDLPLLFCTGWLPRPRLVDVRLPPPPPGFFPDGRTIAVDTVVGRLITRVDSTTVTLLLVEFVGYTPVGLRLMLPGCSSLAVYSRPPIRYLYLHDALPRAVGCHRAPAALLRLPRSLVLRCCRYTTNPGRALFVDPPPALPSRV